MNYVYIGVSIFLLVIASTTGYKVGENHIQVQFDKYRIAQDEALKKANSDSLKRQNELQAKSDEVATTAAKSIKAVESYYAKHPTIVYRSSIGLFDHSANGSIKLPKNPFSSSGTNDPSLDAGHLTQIIEPDLVARCADTTVRFMGLQEWAKKISQ